MAHFFGFVTGKLTTDDPITLNFPEIYQFCKMWSRQRGIRSILFVLLFLEKVEYAKGKVFQ